MLTWGNKNNEHLAGKCPYDMMRMTETYIKPKNKDLLLSAIWYSEHVNPSSCSSLQRCSEHVCKAIPVKHKSTLGLNPACITHKHELPSLTKMLGLHDYG
ncbi:hypothetical protein V6N11_048907 [Hibiscus sabdariffa]|uniref:Uncharacterized protein n=1 Tax=Hibiscus sabdariffa TaxID=183260 RepID=A0ABR2PX35_9ROSI